MSPLNTAYVDTVVRCEVLLGGTPMPDDVQLLSVRVDLAIGLPDRAQIRVQDPDFAFADSKVLDPGSPVEIRTAYGEAAYERIFTGVVLALEADFDATGSTLDITAMHEASALQRRTSSRGFRDVTAADAIKAVGAGDVQRVDCPSPVYKVLHQAAETDWDFIRRIASEHGGEIVTKDGDVHVQPIDQTTADVASFAFGETILSFRPRLTASRQVDEVEVKGWNPDAKAAVAGQARLTPPMSAQQALLDSAVRGGQGGTLRIPRAVDTAGHATALAKGAAKRLGRAAVEAELLVQGSPILVPGASVKLTGVGKRFSGRHRIVSATHLIADGGYETRMHLGSEPPQLATDGAARPRVQTEGLLIGIVSSLGSEPADVGKVKLKLPALDERFETGWARVAHEAAGKGRGVVAPLHVDDEVVVGFEHGDPSRPIVLGALFNGRDKPGDVLSDTKLSYAARLPKDVDVLTNGKTTAESEKGLTVGAKGGPVSLSAKDAIELRSTTGDITLQATGNATIDAKGQVQIKGIAAVKISATGQVVLETQGQLQLRGTQVAIQGTAMVQVTAPMVMLG